MKRKKVIEETVEKPKHCTCDNPELIGSIAIGYIGNFQFCKKCRLNRILSDKEIGAE